MEVTFRFKKKVYTEIIEDNIELSELVPSEVMNALNRAVGRYAFYASLRADAKRMQAEIDTEYDLWHSDKFAEVQGRSEFAKEKTLKKIEVKVLLDFQDEYRTWQKRKRRIQNVSDKLLVLVNSFELMTKTLQSVLAMQRSELENAHLSRTGDILEDE